MSVLGFHPRIKKRRAEWRYVQLIALLPVYDNAYLGLHWVVLAPRLKSLSIKQGIQYDDPGFKLAKDIPVFIEFLG